MTLPEVESKVALCEKALQLNMHLEIHLFVWSGLYRIDCELSAEVDSRACSCMTAKTVVIHKD